MDLDVAYKGTVALPLVPILALQVGWGPAVQRGGNPDGRDVWIQCVDGIDDVAFGPQDWTISRN
jgi:hypothetical protein